MSNYACILDYLQTMNLQNHGMIKQLEVLKHCTNTVAKP